MRDKLWDRLFYGLAVELAPTLVRSPIGLAHLAADLADEISETVRHELFLRGRRPSDRSSKRPPERRLTEEEIIAERRIALGLPARRPTLDD